MELKKVKKNI